MARHRPLTADAILGGTFDSFQLDTAINGRALTWAGQAIDRVTAKAIVTAMRSTCRRCNCTRALGFLDGRVRYAWETGAYAANLKGDRLSWQGTVLVAQRHAGDLRDPVRRRRHHGASKGQGELDFALTGGKAGTFIGAGDATADLLGDQARIVARLPAIGALINADIATASPYDYAARAARSIRAAALSPFIGAIETEILGFATGTVTASGRLADARDRVAFVNITELDAGIGGVPVTLISPLNATLKGDDVTLRDLFVRVGSGRLSASGRWNTRLDGVFHAQFAGDFQDAIRLGKAFGVPATFDGTGPMQFNLQSNGSRLGTVGTLSIKNGTFGWVGAAVRGAGAQRQRRAQRRTAHHRAHHRQRRDRRHRRQFLGERRARCRS